MRGCMLRPERYKGEKIRGNESNTTHHTIGSTQILGFQGCELDGNVSTAMCFRLLYKYRHDVAMSRDVARMVV